MKTSDLDYEYPEELIATSPAAPRDSSRLLVLRRGAALEHRRFADLPGYLAPGDCLVVNETKVFACRLAGKKATGGKAELLLVKELEPGVWAALASGLKPGMKFEFPGGAKAEVLSLNADGEYVLRFDRADLMEYLAAHGLAPLPPYILKKRREPAVDDGARYQTVYASQTGSIAAPTAGLHFTPRLLQELRDMGVRQARVTLHVGRGTFRPIQSEEAGAHVMLPEYYRMAEDQAAQVRAAMSEGRRVLSVGTTSTRTLETLARRRAGFGPDEGWTELYITPGFEFKAVTALITNFHLPRSTPLMLAAAFAGKDALLAAYREAVRERYRLYSYGDAMLVL